MGPPIGSQHGILATRVGGQEGILATRISGHGRLRRRLRVGTTVVTRSGVADRTSARVVVCSINVVDVRRIAASLADPVGIRTERVGGKRLAKAAGAQ